MEGLKEIIVIRAAINLGLSDELKSAFPQIIPVNRPLVTNQNVQNPYRLVGFTAGEGCFLISINQFNTINIGWQVYLEFSISQHARDEDLIKNIRDLLNCGNIRNQEKKRSVEFQVRKFSDIETKIIPFFSKYKIEGVKYQDFLDFCEVTKLMQTKVHLTEEGLKQIREIKGRKVGYVRK